MKEIKYGSEGIDSDKTKGIWNHDDNYFNNIFFYKFFLIIINDNLIKIKYLELKQNIIGLRRCWLK